MSFGPARAITLPLARGLFVLTVWGLVGCVATPDPIEFSKARTETALVRWQRGSDAITDRALLSRNPDGAVRIALPDSGDPPSLQITLGADGRLAASGSLLGRRWVGPTNRVPAELDTWVAFLRTWQQAEKLAPGSLEIHSPTHRIAYEKPAEDLRSLSVASSDVRESIAAAFLPNASPTPTTSPSPG